MKPASFVYHAPATVSEAVSLLAELAAQDARIIAGGQSLVPMMAFRLAQPRHLIDINKVSGLDRLSVSLNAMQIGATVRHAAFERPDIRAGVLGLLLAELAHKIAHVPIRRRGTFCGSLANADPAAEWCLAAIVLDATVHIRNSRGYRAEPAADFLQSAMTTSLAEDEMIESVDIPLLPAGTRYGFSEVSRRARDFAMAAALVTFRLDGGIMADVRIGVGGVEHSPRRLTGPERMLAGKLPDPALLQDAAAAAAAAIDPMTDAQTDAVYRRELVAATVLDALQRALK